MERKSDNMRTFSDIRARGTLTLAALALSLLSAACSRELSRGQAGKLIAAHPKFKAPHYAQIVVGEVWGDFRDFPNFIYYPHSEAIKLGLLRVEQTNSYDGFWSRKYIFELTDEGRKAQRRWQLSDKKPDGFYNSDNAKAYRVPLAEKKLDQVVGITRAPMDEMARVVEFYWHWEPMADAKLFPSLTPAGKRHEGAAYLRLYDDGWRVEEIKF